MNIPCSFIAGKDFAITTQPIKIGEFIVPVNFKWNGASIPKLCMTHLQLHPFDKKVRRGSLLHDHLYHIGYDRKKADTLFRELCREDGANLVQCWLMYMALRLMGWIRYRKIRRKDI